MRAGENNVELLEIGLIKRPLQGTRSNGSCCPTEVTLGSESPNFFEVPDMPKAFGPNNSLQSIKVTESGHVYSVDNCSHQALQKGKRVRTRNKWRVGL